MFLQPATPKSGADPGGGGEPGALPPKIGKDMIYLRKMVIFHTKYPNNFRASLRSAQFFKGVKFVSDLRQVCGFLRVLRFPPPIKLAARI